MSMQPTTMHELMDGPLEIEWMIKDLAAMKTTGVIAGKGGACKTFMTHDLALTAAMRKLGYDKKWLGYFDVKPGTVMLVDEENVTPLLRIRFHLMSTALGITKVQLDDLPIIPFVAQNFNMTPTKDCGKPAMFDDFCSQIEKYKPSLIVYDSLSRIHHVKEDKSDEMAGVFQWFKKICDRFDVCNVITHHTTKGDSYNQDSVRGSSDITNFPDWVLTVNKSGGTKRRVTQVKSRWGTELEAFAITLDSHHGVKVVHADASKDTDIDTVIYNFCKSEPRDRQPILWEGAKYGYSEVSIDRVLSALVKQGKLEKDREGRTTIYYADDYGAITTQNRPIFLKIGELAG